MAPGCLPPMTRDIIKAPASIEIAIRTKTVNKEKEDYLFVLNYSDKPQEFTLQATLQNVCTKREETGIQRIEAFETRVYGGKQ